MLENVCEGLEPPEDVLEAVVLADDDRDEVVCWDELLEEGVGSRDEDEGGFELEGAGVTASSKLERDQMMKACSLDLHTCRQHGRS
jgi:hypothetical protein